MGGLQLSQMRKLAVGTDLQETLSSMMGDIANGMGHEELVASLRDLLEQIKSVRAGRGRWRCVHWAGHVGRERAWSGCAARRRVGPGRGPCGVGAGGAG